MQSVQNIFTSTYFSCTCSSQEMSTWDTTLTSVQVSFLLRWFHFTVIIFRGLKRLKVLHISQEKAKIWEKSKKLNIIFVLYFFISLLLNGFATRHLATNGSYSQWEARLECTQNVSNNFSLQRKFDHISNEGKCVGSKGLMLNFTVHLYFNFQMREWSVQSYY